MGATPSPSTGQRAVVGAAWSIALGAGARLLGLTGTVALTHFIAPNVAGELSAAAIAVLSASQLSQLGVGNYLIAHARAPRSVAGHATVINLSLGVIALGAVTLWRAPIARWVRAPGAADYVPGLAFAMFLDRIAFIPERILARELRFRRLGATKALSEAALPLVAVTSAALGCGGMSLVFGNIARSATNLWGVLSAVDWHDWLHIGPLDRATLRRLSGYGLVVWVVAWMETVARRWDNLLISRYWGTWIMGGYNLAYNLADIPAIQVGEQITDVLFAALANLSPDRRRPALLRALSLIALLLFPLSIGLGCIANTLVAVFLDARWTEVGPMLMILSCMAITRPIGNALQAYLMAQNRPGAGAWIESLNVAAIGVGLATLGRLDPRWACVAIGLAFTLRLLAAIWAIKWYEGISPLVLLRPCWRPLLACIPMLLAVWVVRYGFRGGAVAAQLASEIAAGALFYLIGARLLAPQTLFELVDMVRRMARRARSVPA